MAKYIVPPKKMSREVIIKCYKCGALYVPEGMQKSILNSTNYENCPVCGYSHNSNGNRIPLWKYNLIKYYREKTGKKEEMGGQTGEEIQA